MNVATEKPEYLTLAEASERYHLAVRTLRGWRSRRLITRYERKDGLAVVDAREIEQELASRTEEVRNLDENPSSDQAEE